MSVKNMAALLLASPSTSFHWPDWLFYFRQFDTYFVLFIAAFLCTFIATPIYILLAKRIGWVDLPGGRKKHEQATATMGGLVIFAVVLCGTLIAIQTPNLVGQMLQENLRSIYALLACSGCMVLLGIVDDRAGVRPRVKLMVQTVVAIAAVSLGYQIQAITLPGWESVRLPVAASVVLSIVWIVGITNAINLSDGLDGLATGICLLAAGVNAIVAIWLGNHYMTVMMVLLAGALLGFLKYNFHPARVFLGDTGALALGMYLALASLHSAQKAHTVVLILVPLFALGYPIFDTLLAVGRRLMRGQPLFVSDRDHIHHRLLDRSQSPSKAAIQIYIASVLVSLVCIAAMTANHFALGLGVAGVLVMAIFGARVLGYLEWGGWAARWLGREETKVLHAAANLSRMKIQHASHNHDLVQSLGYTAHEIGCREIVLNKGVDRIRWVDPYYQEFNPAVIDSAFSPESEATSEQKPQTISGEFADPQNLVAMDLAPDARIEFRFAEGCTPSEEQLSLLEELCRDIGTRLK